MARGFVLVAVADGRVAGSAGFDAYQFPWNGDLWCFNNTWLYVHPDFRCGGTTAGLIRHAVKFAEARRAPIIMGNTSGWVKRAWLTHPRGHDRAIVDGTHSAADALILKHVVPAGHRHHVTGSLPKGIRDCTRPQPPVDEIHSSLEPLTMLS